MDELDALQERLRDAAAELEFPRPVYLPLPMTQPMLPCPAPTVVVEVPPRKPVAYLFRVSRDEQGQIDTVLAEPIEPT